MHVPPTEPASTCCSSPMIPLPSPKASFQSRFLFSLFVKASQGPRFSPATTLQPCLATAGAACRVPLVAVGAGAPATACGVRWPWPSEPYTQPPTFHWWPRRHKLLEDLEQGRANQESPDRIKASPSWLSFWSPERQG